MTMYVGLQTMAQRILCFYAMHVGQRARKDVTGLRYRTRVWHPALTLVAEEGGVGLLGQALAARQFNNGRVVYSVHREDECLHTHAVTPEGDRVPVPNSPFPADSTFGILRCVARSRHDNGAGPGSGGRGPAGHRHGEP